MKPGPLFEKFTGKGFGLTRKFPAVSFWDFAAECRSFGCSPVQGSVQSSVLERMPGGVDRFF